MNSFHVHSLEVLGMDSGGPSFPWLQWGKDFKKKGSLVKILSPSLTKAYVPQEKALLTYRPASHQ